MKHFKLLKGMLACLLSLALVFSCFEGVGLQAAETAAETTVTAPNAVTAEYDLATNSLTASSAAYVYVLKAKTGNSIKAGKTTAKQMAATTGGYSISMSDLGVKKENKDAYFYVCDKEFEADATSITANFIIKATTAKKVTATIDFTKADDIEGFNVISVKATDTKNAEIANPDVVWSTEANGTYVGVNDDTASTTRKYADGKTAAKNGFDGRTLKEMYGSTIYVKLNGVGGASETATFPSKAIKVKIAKQGKATAMKIDVKKDTISLKNGFDFALAELDETTKEYRIVGEWHTILPYLKSASVKTIGESIVLTGEYTPLGKKDKNAGKKVTTDNGDTYSYTSLKVKTLSINDLLKILDESGALAADGKYTIAVRKSASEKKPASAESYIEIGVQAEEPLVYTQDNVKGQYLVATSTDFNKKGIVLGTVVPFPGSVSGEDTIATKGYDDTFEVGVTSNSGDTIVNADKGGSSFEFAIVQQKDLVAEGTKAIDWTTLGWKKLDPAKTKITGKLNSKYNLLDGTKVKATLDTISAKSAQANFSDVKTFIVIRRAGVKAGNTRASEYIKLYVAKEGKNYNLYSTVDNGAEAFKYTIKFVKYQKVGDNYIWDLASDVEDVSVWAATGDKKYVALPESTTAKLFAASAASGADILDEAVTSVSGGTNKGKYEVTGVADGTTEYIAIREYANVKIVAAFSGESTTETLFTITNGKSSISGDNTVYYVGDAIEIPSASGAPTAVAGYNISIVNVASPADGFAKVEEGTIKTKAYTAEETTVKVTYLKTPVTKSFIIENDKTKFTYEAKDGCLGDKDNLATYGTDIKLEIKPATGKKITAVKYKVGDGELKPITGTNDIYTIPGNVILDTITVEVTTADAE